MDFTQGTKTKKNERAIKMMLWFGIVSLIMSFGGLTSAFIVSSTREDWLTNFQLPNAFFYSTLIIVLSSVSLYAAKKTLIKGSYLMTLLLLIVTYLFGISFILIQFYGFNEIVHSGYNFTGPTSNITMSYVYIIAVFHILHVLAGLIVLTLVIIKHLKRVYNSKNILGFELASTFWHFVDFLWVYLFLFLYFFNKIN